jgi:lysophospholipase L1-like esterase
MKLFTFGDSWTEGVGGNLKEENTTDIPEERTAIRQKYCWPTHLSKLLQCETFNNGVGAFSNNAIFNAVCSQLKKQIITSDDLVIIMWSSSLRDPLPFFPNLEDFFIWGNRYKSKGHLLKYIFDGIEGDTKKYNTAEKKFRNYYISNLFNDTYYDIVNQNYIIHLQFIFKELGIRYIFCDAFDTMITKNINSSVDNTHFIDSDRYWGYQNKTMADLLIDTDRKDVWENNLLWSDDISGKHPSNNGYSLIADELFKFINENALLNHIKSKNLHLI